MAADVLSELLIAQLLEEDIRMVGYHNQAETFQLTQTLADSVRGKNRIPKRAAREPTPDADLALCLMAEEARLSSDAVFAQSLQHSDDAEATANRQYALRLAASEKKLMLDAEFAKKLQAADDEVDVDAPNMKDAESVLGRGVIDRIMAVDPNDKGKGKAKADADTKRRYPGSDDEIHSKRIKKEDEQVQVKVKDGDENNTQLFPTCGICMDKFHATYSPLSASQTANTSSRLPFGMVLPCPKSHPYCLDCISTYIKTKLDPDGDGSGNPNVAVFPIPCSR